MNKLRLPGCPRPPGRQRPGYQATPVETSYDGRDNGRTPHQASLRMRRLIARRLQPRAIQPHAWSALRWSIAAIFALLFALWSNPALAQDTPTLTATETIPATPATPTAEVTAAATIATTPQAPQSAPQATVLFFLTPWVSPTPGADGAITIIVQPGEALWTIAARAGLSLQELLELNNLPENAIIQPGDTLLIGYGTPEAPPTSTLAPEEATQTATAPEGRPTLPPPTPRPTQGSRHTAAVCLSAFDDLNRNGQQDPGEPLRAGVAFTVFNTAAVVGNYVTDGVSEPYCIEQLAAGEYQVTRSLLPGEVLTTDGHWRLVLAAGSRLSQAFGSYMGEAAVAQLSPSSVTPMSTEATATPAAVADTAHPLAGSERVTTSTLPANIGPLLIGLGISLLILAAVLILLFRRLRPGSS